MTRDFPITALRDEEACSVTRRAWRPPRGWAGPRGHRGDRMRIHRCHHAPVPDFRCDPWGRVLHACTGTTHHGIRRRPSDRVLIVRGIAPGVPTAQLARVLDYDRSELVNLRHRRPDLAFRPRDRMPLEDQIVEADEASQNGGANRWAAARSRRPAATPGEPGGRPWPGRWDNDRPPIGGGVGRDSGPVRRTVTEPSGGATVEPVVRRATGPKGTVHTAGWPGGTHWPALGRRHATVCHPAGERARDDAGDGSREVHDNSREGLWTGLRNFLRPFRGVNQKYLHQDVAHFEWGSNVKRATVEFLHALLGVRHPTSCPT